MQRLIFSVLFVLIAFLVQAHSISSTSYTLTQSTQGWMLSLQFSPHNTEHLLDAEIKQRVGETELKQKLVEHLKANISIRANKKKIALGKGLLNLGSHVHLAVFRLEDFPKQLKNLILQLSSFAEVHPHQHNYLSIKQGAQEQNFTVHNHEQLNLEQLDGKFVEAEEASRFSAWITLGILPFFALCLLVLKSYK